MAHPFGMMSVYRRTARFGASSRSAGRQLKGLVARENSSRTDT